MLIGFTGLKGSGKDAAAAYLISKGWKRLAFADPLKEVCRHLFNFTDRQLHGDLKEVPDPVWSVTPRQTFTYIGTELIRKQLGPFLGVGEDFWCLHMKQQISATTTDVVITDVRFDNEAALIKSMGGHIVRIIRPAATGADSHISEQGDFLADETIVNDSTIEDLHKKVATLKWIDQSPKKSNP